MPKRSRRGQKAAGRTPRKKLTLWTPDEALVAEYLAFANSLRFPSAETEILRVAIIEWLTRKNLLPHGFTNFPATKDRQDHGNEKEYKLTVTLKCPKVIAAIAAGRRAKVVPNSPSELIGTALRELLSQRRDEGSNGT